MLVMLWRDKWPGKWSQGFEGNEGEEDGEVD